MSLNQTLENARAILSRHDVRHLEEALRDNPDGPVQSITTRGARDVEYEVVVGDVKLGDHGRARVLWSRTVMLGQVTLGQIDQTSAVCFTAVAHAQEEVATAAHVLLSAGEAGEPGEDGEDGEADEEEVPGVVRSIASSPPREPPIHVIDQAGQPYGSTRRCCNMCGLMAHPDMKFVTTRGEWWDSPKETRCDAKTP